MAKRNIILLLTLILSAGSALFFHFYLQPHGLGQELGITTHHLSQNRPYKVGLQVGHWKVEELPDEFKQLRDKNTEAVANGIPESQINMDIATRTAELLLQHNVQIDILPATIPPHYKADAFIAIHADQSKDPDVSGYKIAAPADDQTGIADDLVDTIEKQYSYSTQLKQDTHFTDAMYHYYAFNWKQRQHSIDPTTPAAIIELGFMSNKKDFDLLTRNPEKAANGLAKGILDFLDRQ